ncbi:type II toxin-antitoxin system RelE/ParE family toxin [Lichenibacterium ramalinae]|uniref:Type II toxin-antitoxin system RelE/ParE family toxin n=1 Tax=Lichenibacterium ramalinae TaxID=2316527 RepID=A0A4Q2RDZ7_9HYPH|nr:type II toxin-antitoxin system RelE/ParE family toxin [Lichenibacterium ramalinae]
MTYIGERSPQGAESVGLRLRSLFALLAEHPFIGRTTDRPGVRRLSAQPSPCAVFYRVSGQTVIVQRIRRVSRRLDPS